MPEWIQQEVKIEDRIHKVAEKAKTGIARSIKHSAAIVRKVAIQSIVKTKKWMHSAEGSPVFTHRGTFFRRGILFQASDDSAVIGPAFSKVGDVGYFHEFGKRRGRTKFPVRATMGPALEQSVNRFGNSFRGSIGA